MAEIGTQVYKTISVQSVGIVSQPGTILSGETVLAGSVVGKITASGKLKLCDSTATDGSEDPFAVIPEDVDASAADTETITYQTGVYNQDELIFGGTDTIATHRVALRLLNIHAVGSVSAAGKIT